MALLLLLFDEGFVLVESLFFLLLFTLRNTTLKAFASKNSMCQELNTASVGACPLARVPVRTLRDLVAL